MAEALTVEANPPHTAQALAFRRSAHSAQTAGGRCSVVGGEGGAYILAARLGVQMKMKRQSYWVV